MGRDSTRRECFAARGRAANLIIMVQISAGRKFCGDGEVAAKRRQHSCGRQTADSRFAAMRSATCGCDGRLAPPRKFAVRDDRQAAQYN